MKSKIKNQKHNADKNEIEIEIELALSKTFPTSLFMKGIQLSRSLAFKLLQNTGVVAVSVVAYNKFYEMIEPFFLITKLINKTDIPKFKFQVKFPDVSNAFVSIAEIFKYKYSDKQIESIFRTFNKYFSVQSISELRKIFDSEIFFWNEGALEHIFLQELDPSHKIPKHLVDEKLFQPSSFKYFYMLRDVLYDDNIVSQYPIFVKHFFNSLLFILENHKTMTFLGFVGGSVLIYNRVNSLRGPKMNEMKQQELKTNALEDFSKILNIIAKEHGLTQVFEHENTKHMFSKYELVIPSGSSAKEKTEKIRQFKMFLQIIPPNVFINEATFNNTQLLPKNNDVKVEDMDAIGKSIKKYVDTHIERYVYRHPTTISQKIKKNFKREPRFSPNVNQ